MGEDEGRGRGGEGRRREDGRGRGGEGGEERRGGDGKV